MKCPNCNSKLSKLGLFRITAWSSLKCPRCKALLNRRIDLQLFLVALLGTSLAMIVPFLVLIQTGSWPLFYVSIVLLVLLVWITDMLTVKLHKAEKRSGISRVLGHKIVD